MANYRDGERKKARGKLILLIVTSLALIFLGVIQYWTIRFLLDDSSFLQRANGSADGLVSAVFTSVIFSGNGPSTVLCHEDITFQPAGGGSVTFRSEGADHTFTATNETCGNQGDYVTVLYNPRDPSDARVADVVHNDLVIKGIQEGILALLTLSLVGSGLSSLAGNVRARRKRRVT